MWYKSSSYYFKVQQLFVEEELYKCKDKRIYRMVPECNNLEVLS